MITTNNIIDRYFNHTMLPLLLMVSLLMPMSESFGINGVNHFLLFKHCPLQGVPPNLGSIHCLVLVIVDVDSVHSDHALQLPLMGPLYISFGIILSTPVSFTFLKHKY